MTDYITAEDVDELLGAGWEGDGDRKRSVLEANAYMSAQGVTHDEEETPAAVATAGAYLAKAAAERNLYVTNDGRVESERVRADTVEVDTSYQSGSAPRNAEVSLARDLLRPYLPAGGGSQFRVSRA